MSFFCFCFYCCSLYLFYPIRLCKVEIIKPCSMSGCCQDQMGWRADDSEVIPTSHAAQAVT